MLSPRIVIPFIVVIGALAYWKFASADRGVIEVKHRYLLVDVAGPPDWEKQHAFTIRWRDQEYPIPVVFRIRAEHKDFTMGASINQLQIGQETAFITSKPETKFESRNTGVTALLEEAPTAKENDAFSTATSVLISPPEHPGEIGPRPSAEVMKQAAERLRDKIRNLLRRAASDGLPLGFPS